MTREAQNVFGADMPLDELMGGVKDLTEGMGDVETPNVTGLLQKIQATAVVVDMSNEALVKYFDVMKNMYKGMGIKGPNSTEMAQNALLTAKATVDARKKRAEDKGVMYTGASTEEEAQQIAEIQGNVARSGTQADVAGFLDTLSSEGTEGQVRQRIIDKMNAGDAKGAQEVITNARASGELSESAMSRGTAAGQRIFDEGLTDEAQSRVNALLNEKGQGALNASDVTSAFKSSKDYIGETMVDSMETGETARDLMGEDGEQKVKDFVSNELTQADLKDRAGLTQKIQNSMGLDKEGAEKLATSMQNDMDDSALNKYGIALTDKDRDARLIKQEEERQEVLGEIKTIGKERSGQLRDMNIGAEAFGAAKVAFKKLQGKAKEGVQVSAKDLAEEQGKDWDKMSAEEKKSFQATFDLAQNSVTGEENETTKEYEKISEESKSRATKEVEEKSKKYTMTDEEKNKEITERTNKYTEESLKEKGIDGGIMDKDSKEKDSFDPKDAVEKISRLLESIADKLGVKEITKTANPDTANAKTENSGGWWPW